MIQTSLYTIYIKLQNSDKFLLVHGYSGAIDVVDREIAEFLRTGGRISEEAMEEGQFYLGEVATKILLDRGYLTRLTPYQEKRFVHQVAARLHLKSKQESSFLFLMAYDCNFRCSYCFENSISDHGHGWSKKVFDKGLVDRAYEAISEIEPDFSMHAKRITLYGGEPLLAENYDVVSYIVSKGCKLGYSFGAISNGYDLEKYMHLLQPGKIESLQITLDGMAKEHNRRRTHYSEHDTFSKITDNIDKALQAGVNVCIRINVDKSNLDDLPRLSSFFNDRGWRALKNFSAYSSVLKNLTNDNIKCNAVILWQFSVVWERCFFEKAISPYFCVCFSHQLFTFLRILNRLVWTYCSVSSLLILFYPTS